MMNMIRIAAFAIAASLVCGAVSLSGCSSISGGDAVVIAVESQPKSLDPRLGSIDSVSARLHSIIFDSLVRKNDRFEFVPYLAESFDRSPDARTFTFKLRKGVMTHSGRELTSADVKFTYESIKSPELKSPVAASFARIESIETPDPLTAVFHCREPYYQLLGDLAAIPVMVNEPNAAKGLPVGTGPFKVVEASEQAVELEANEAYFQGAPAIKKLRVRVVTDNNTRELELKSGGVDLAINSGFAPDSIAKMQSDPELQVIKGPGTNIAHIGLNVQDEVLRDPKVRQALACALNRDKVIATVMQGQARPADALMPPESWAYEPNIPRYPYDIARAKQLLDSAGYRDPDGDGPQVRFTIGFTTSNTGTAPAIAQIVQEQWRAIGVGVNPEQFERVTFFDRLAQGNFDAYYIISVGANQSPDVFSWAYYAGYWAPDRSDLDKAASSGDDAGLLAVLERKEYCPNPEVDRLVVEAKTGPADKRLATLLAAYSLLTSRGAGNRMRYCSPFIDEMILKAETSASRDEQKSLYSKIQIAAANDQPQIYLWYTDNVIVARKRITNVTVDPSGAWYFLKNVRADG